MTEISKYFACTQLQTCITYEPNGLISISNMVNASSECKLSIGIQFALFWALQHRQNIEKAEISCQNSVMKIFCQQFLMWIDATKIKNKISNACIVNTYLYETNLATFLL